MAKYDRDTKTISINRGDSATLSITANMGSEPFTFLNGDVIYFKVTEKGNENNVVLFKQVSVEEEVQSVNVSIDDNDTRFGEIINKPVNYWYEVSVIRNGKTQTLIGYDDDGAKLFVLLPEAGDING